MRVPSAPTEDVTIECQPNRAVMSIYINVPQGFSGEIDVELPFYDLSYMTSDTSEDMTSYYSGTTSASSLYTDFGISTGKLVPRHNETCTPRLLCGDRSASTCSPSSAP